jgi:hypothetical protein
MTALSLLGRATRAGAPAPKPGVTFKHELAAMMAYCLMGCGFLAGWNAFLTAIDFFGAAFPVRTDPEGTQVCRAGSKAATIWTLCIPLMT